MLKDATKSDCVLPQKSCDLLFHNVRSIATMNQGLADSLEKRLSVENQPMGDLFIEFAPLFQVTARRSDALCHLASAATAGLVS